MDVDLDVYVCSLPFYGTLNFSLFRSDSQPTNNGSQDAILPADSPIQEESQTQHETQRLPTPTCTQMDSAAKRKNTPPEVDRATKKVKISVGPAVDLGDWSASTMTCSACAFYDSALVTA